MQDVAIGDVDGDLVVANEDDNRLLLNDGFVHVYANDGRGHFTEATIPFLGRRYRESAFDIAVGDFGGDGLADLFICNRGINGRGVEDRLVLRSRSGL